MRPRKWDQISLPPDVARIIKERCYNMTEFALIQQRLGRDFLDTLIYSAYLQGACDALDAADRKGENNA